MTACRISARYCVAILITGVVAGLSGGLLSLLLHWVQHLTFGYSTQTIISPITFLEGMQHTSPTHRFWGIVGAGLVVMIGNQLLHRLGKVPIDIPASVKDPDKPVPILSTLFNAIIQIVSVAMGSPLGREVAPREVGALASRLGARALGISRERQQLLIACGAGGGLAAVYNVPLAGTLFTLEVLLLTFNRESITVALITSAIATAVSNALIGNHFQYQLPAVASSTALLFWAIILGPVMGVGAWLFRYITQRAKQGVDKGPLTLVICLLAFILTAILSLWQPALPGNGKGAFQLGLDGHMTLLATLALLASKLVVILGVLRGGAKGGLLTPGLAVGALVSTLVWMLISAWLPSLAPAQSATTITLLGAAGFLGASMQMPLTALCLVMEVTNMPVVLLLPAVFTLGGAFATCRWLENR